MPTDEQMWEEDSRGKTLQIEALQGDLRMAEQALEEAIAREQNAEHRRNLLKKAMRLAMSDLGTSSFGYHVLRGALEAQADG